MPKPLLALRLAPLALFLALWMGAPDSAHAQDPGEVAVSYGGWSAFGGFVTYAALTPLARYATQAAFAPEEPGVCAAEPSRCEPGVAAYTLSGLTLLTHLGVSTGGGWAAGRIADGLDLDPGLGWGLAGGMLGLPAMGLIAYGLPRYEAEWLWTAQTLTLLCLGAGGGGLGLWAVARERGHAWPEFIGGSLGLVVGIGLGSLVCGDEGCAAVPLLGGLGALVGAGVTGVAWGYAPDPGDDAVELVRGGLAPYQIQLAF